MSDLVQYENDINSIIEELQGICNENGLTNSAAGEIVVTSTFLYKFLNDKFISNLHKFCDDMKYDFDEFIKNENDEMDAFYDTYSTDVAFAYEDTIQSLIKNVGKKEFYKDFDNALERISNYKRNEDFNVQTADGETKPLFTRITEQVEASKRNNFAKNIFTVISKSKFDFGPAFENNYDFYSTIFETLISNYNKDSGDYAEYFTPQSISAFIAKILVNMSPLEDTIYEIYDPAAGSGSLVLHLANALGKGKFGDKARVYTQDVSQKSTRFLRLNMLLNGLTASLDNIIEGNTLTQPAHFNEKGNANSGIKHFDFITANPPFKCDFSTSRDSIETSWAGTDRFFAGVPKVPNQDKKKMAIYLCFIQHILYSLKEHGKAAVVVPTGFITAQTGIEKSIRQKLIDKKWLKGCVSMPSNIFANTGTNVSVIFIDKSNENNKEANDVILIDASNMGHDEKVKGNQRTVITEQEINKIEETFINKVSIDDFSIKVTYDQIKEKNYSFSAGQYFDIKIEYVDLTQKEFKEKMDLYKKSLNELFVEGKKLEDEITKQFEELEYE